MKPASAALDGAWSRTRDTAGPRAIRHPLSARQHAGDDPGLLRDLARHLCETLGFSASVIGLLEPADDTLQMVAAWAADGAHDGWIGNGARIGLPGEPRLHDAVRERRVVEVHRDNGAGAECSWPRPADTKTSVHAPLVHLGRVVGTLSLHEVRRQRLLNDEERRLLAVVAPSLGAALHGSRLLQEETERNRQLDSLLTSIRAMTSTATLADVLDVVAAQAAAAFAVPCCAIYEHDEPGDQLVLRAVYDREPPAQESDPLGTTYPLADFPGDRALLAGGEMVGQLLSDPDLDPATRLSMEKYGEQSCLSVPLAFKGRTEGLLEIIETRWERHFTAAERELAQGIGEQAAAAIVNCRLFRQLRDATDALESQLQVRHTLLELSEALLTLRDREAVCEATARVLSTIVRYETMDISLIDRETNELVEVFEGEGSVNKTIGLRLPLGVGVCGAVIESGRPEMVNDMMRDPRAVQVPDTDEEEQAAIVVPLQIDGEILGVLAISRYGGRTFTEREFQLAQLVSNLAAIAIQNARLYDALQEKAIRDGLTGLYSHRYFYERLAQEVVRSQRYGSSLSLLMIDIDDFKRFNDAHGHLVGDQALQQVAACLAAEVRKHVDMVARYGGEEFAVLLPNTACRTLEEGETPPDIGAGRPAHVVADRIRQRVAAAVFGDPDGDHRGRLSVSIGIGTLPDVAYDEQQLIGSADKALYLAKRLGKDRVEVYRP